MGKKIVVGMSGGVDSSVAALLLKKQGYEVIGVFMQMTGASSAGDAQKVAEYIGIPLYLMDAREAFQKNVTGVFVKEYLRGRTPNPCVVCNRYVKWQALTQYAKEQGAEGIATGHYARIDRLANERFAVRNSATAKKDQTYALYALTQEQLSKTRFPLGDYEKEEVREIALAEGLPVADKPDSQDICFVPDGDYAGFIERESRENLKTQLPDAGNFVTQDGRIIGRHKGIIHYTVGQRRGLALPMGKRVFVTEIRPETNEVVVGENEALFTTKVVCDALNYMAIDDLREPKRVLAKIRYNHVGEFGVIQKQPDGSVECTFERAVRAATPGQAVVFYDGEYVLGGGTIR